MASLQRKEKKNGEVVYRIQVSLWYDKETGKRKDKVITFKPNQNASMKQQEKEAKKYAIEWEDKLKNGESYEGEEMSFADFAEKWLESRKEELAYSTYIGYVQIVNNKIVPALGQYKVARIKPPVIEEFYKSLVGNLANGSIQKVKNVLSGMFRTAVRWQMIQVNPCRDAKLAKNKDEETTLKYFTPEQSFMFLHSLDMEFETIIKGHERIDDTGKPYYVADYVESRKLPLQLKVFYTISLCCGLRKGETLALHWNDIDFDSAAITINKTVTHLKNGKTTVSDPKTKSSNRTVYIDKKTLVILQQWQNMQRIELLKQGVNANSPQQLVFTNMTNSFIVRDTSDRWIKKISKESGVHPISPHGFRHTYATLAIQSGMNPKELQAQLGHSNIQTTLQIYTAITNEQRITTPDKFVSFVNF